MRRNYYTILGISRGADGEEIRKAYRSKALLHHPDRNPENRKSAEEQFKEIGEAYEILGDPERRERYHLLGFNGVRDFVSIIRPSRYYERFNEVFSDREKLSIFSLCRTYGKIRRRGYDLYYSLTPVPRELKAGIAKVIEVKRREYCHTCQGEKKVKNETCPECFGLGRKSYRRRVKVGIPPGTKPGTELTFQGKGHQGFRGAPPGNLVIQLAGK